MAKVFGARVIGFVTFFLLTSNFIFCVATDIIEKDVDEDAKSLLHMGRHVRKNPYHTTVQDASPNDLSLSATPNVAGSIRSTTGTDDKEPKGWLENVYAKVPGNSGEQSTIRREEEVVNKEDIPENDKTNSVHKVKTNNNDLWLASTSNRNSNDIVDNFIPDDGYSMEKVKSREKRQTPTDVKNQYQSISQNATGATPDSPKDSSLSATPAAPPETSVVVPYNAAPGNDRLLGVNGTGQRKDMTTKQQAKPTVVSDPIQSTTGTDTAKKPNGSLGNVLAAVPGNSGGQSTKSVMDEVVDKIDVPENETIADLQNQNYTVNVVTDHHSYYNSTMYVDKVRANEIWNIIKNTTHNSMLSQSHRRAMTVELSFDFPFYGHPVRNVTVATGGFLYTGEYVHSWLAATQYIAPLMANFDTSLGNDSFVRLNDNGTAFTVIWENVSLQDRPDVGKFTFSTILYKNGDIMFTYFNVPIFVRGIQDDKHPVKVGLSDAYIIDKVIYFARRKTIYEYHRVNFGSSDITNATIIYLTSLTTCLNYTDCVSCINHETTFDCVWCPLLNRCSTGTDRKKQDWLQKGCDRAQITDVSACPAIGQRGNNANQTSSNDSSQATSPNSSSSNNNNKSNSNEDNFNHDDSSLYPYHSNDSDSATITPVKTIAKETKAALEDHAEPKSVGLALGFIVPICLVLVVMMWILYAYRNPHTKSGQLLIQYRPSHWSWRRGEARYTAATIHM